jgi:hypothetical protein
MCDHLEQTHGCRDAQMSQSQIRIYPQEAVSNDAELNQLWQREMLCLSDGKRPMDLTQCIEALDNIAVLADGSSPRRTSRGPGGQQPPRSTNRLKIGPDSGGDANSGDDDEGCDVPHGPQDHPVKRAGMHCW